MKWENIDTSYKNRLEILAHMKPLELFEVQPSCSEQDLKKAYREKMKLYHPDKTHPFMKEYGEEVTKLINIAYKKARVELGYEYR
jgi:DnaJ-class molecular chaperone